mmetsp:Transcript_23415/g.79317  ORF Transcript_23415/g.79317 Transcript_23415/m.79317 type:complete len:311 (-) Transcript_23415:67-999(-)|eukprot:CAMPEP_0203953990 /NCGR_PEP_ID=MMETSP0359-20131031/87207_1 /ASSEMBLY_ACC=CAM_ASM_000338 /TAXON_ID=268821 /ORGANISM="Scrippsiella Hangoei, Strain SHTV-5" /LENGTH=310 /DNA_ID=CAMNT_0050887475 /DNA_START=120 /DNA_END=1052 /DNA_ORIENTATION=-
MALRQERGCLPFTNSLVIVPQDRYVAVENFGKYHAAVKPGLHFSGIDCCGCCISYKSITARIEQTTVVVETKTKDNVFVSATIAVQQSVQPERTVDAMYKLSDVRGQMLAYIADAVRSTVPRLSLEQCFERKDDISWHVHNRLKAAMDNYGFQIHKALLTDLVPNSEVMAAMNEIHKQKRLRDAAIMAAEANKIQVVKAAEAAAESAQLQGEGIARQRKAIMDGLRDSLSTTGGEDIDSTELANMLLLTQYFDTIRAVAADSEAQTVFIPVGPGMIAETAEQIRCATLQGAPAQLGMRSDTTTCLPVAPS